MVMPTWSASHSKSSQGSKLQDGMHHSNVPAAMEERVSLVNRACQKHNVRAMSEQVGRAGEQYQQLLQAYCPAKPQR